MCIYVSNAGTTRYFKVIAEISRSVSTVLFNSLVSLEQLCHSIKAISRSSPKYHYKIIHQNTSTHSNYMKFNGNHSWIMSNLFEILTKHQTRGLRRFSERPRWRACLGPIQLVRSSLSKGWVVVVPVGENLSKILSVLQTSGVCVFFKIN